MRVLMIGRIVLYPEDRTRIIVPGHLLQEVQIRLGVEYAITPIEKPGRVNLDAAENLHAPTLPGDRNLWLHSTPSPRRVQGRILPEGGFVAMDQCRALRSGVFF